MNPRETLEALSQFLQAEPALQAATVAAPAKKGDPPEARSLNLAEDAERFFRKAIDAAVGAKLDPLAWTLRDYDPLYKPDPDELESVKAADVAALTLATNRFDDLAPLAPFVGADDAYIRRLQYWGVVLSDSAGAKAYFFRAFTGAAELHRKRGAALSFKAGTFHQVEERIFLFAEGIDCFVFGDFAFVIQKGRYRRIFDQMQQVYRRATQAATDLHAKLPIANFDEFQRACGSDARLADKVLAVRGRDYFDELCFDFVKPVIDEFKLEIPTVADGDGGVQLQFHSQPAHRFRILKLLDDDFLRSAMTNHRYEVNSKTAPPEA